MRAYTVTLIAAALTAAAGTAIAQPSPMYRITVLPVVGGDVTDASIKAINEAGVVAGEADVDKPGGGKQRQSVFRWSPARGLEWSPEGQHGPTFARGVDRNGRVFGTIWKPFGFQGAVTWSLDDRIKPIERSPGGNDSFLIAANERGDAIGTRSGTGATLWPRGGEPISIGDGSDWGFTPNALNQRREVAGGSYQVGKVGGEAFIWSPPAGMRKLGLFPGSSETGYTEGTAINDHGTVVGAWRARRFGKQQMFRWTEANGFELIPMSGECTPLAINNDEWIIAFCDRGSNTGHALFTPGNGMQFIRDLIDPNDPLLSDVEVGDVRDINDAGTIVGTGVRFFNGGLYQRLPLMLTRVP